jgi:hopene-associated glycosyltransferase HpnB
MIDVLAGLAFAAWVYLFFLHHRFWHGGERLPREVPSLDSWPSVIAIVPARDEAVTIGDCVCALMAQNYAGDFSIIVVDDASSDGTNDIVRTLIAQNSGVTAQNSELNHAGATFHRAEIIPAPPLLDGWTGKLSALDAGLRRADSRPNSSEYIWFTDADVVHPPETLSKLTAKALQNQCDLTSLMVRLRCESFWERRLIPAFIYFFQMLYPFPAVNDRRAKTAAAAGGCVLLRRESLDKSGGLEAVSGKLIDDCAVAAAIKRNGGQLWLGLSDGSKSLRTAESLGPLWAMVRRTAYTQLRYSPALLIFTVAAMSLIFLAPPALALTYPAHNNGLAALVGLTCWIAMAFSYGPTLKDYGRNPWESFLLPLSSALYAAMTVDSALAHGRHRGGQWKGRHYGPSAGTGNLSEFP